MEFQNLEIETDWTVFFLHLIHSRSWSRHASKSGDSLHQLTLNLLEAVVETD